MTPRQATILRSVIRAHLRTGEPIGSLSLADHGALPWSSATLRHELSNLEEEGFLTHPHTSAGRVPTTQGWRYYVDHCAGRGELPKAMSATLNEAAHTANDHVTLARALAHALARLSGTLAVVALGDVSFHEAGLGRLVRMREFADAQTAEDVENLLDLLPEVSDDLAPRAQDEPLVFINGENPYTHTERASVVVITPTLRSGESMLAALVGPVRMPYERHVRLLSAVRDLMRQLEQS